MRPVSRRTIVPCLAFVIVLLATVPGAGVEMPPSYKGWEVGSVAVAGLPKGTARALVKGLALAQTTGLLGTGHPTLYEDVFVEDVNRTVLFLARRGYPYARVDVEFDARPRSRSVAITLVIDPGPAVVADSVAVTGVPAEFADAAGRRVSIERGAVFSDAAASEATTGIVELLRDRGYADATAETKLRWPDSTRVAVTFAATPGARYRFGAKHVQGASDDLVPLVRKSIEANRGEWYSPRDLRRSRDNLRLLDLFRQVRVQTRPAGGDTLDTVADLILAEPRSLEVGLGYWTDDLIRGRARWLHRNLFRRGRGFSIGASASKFSQKGNASVWWPALIGARTRLATTYEIEHQDEDNYELLRNGFDVGLSYQYSIRTTARLGINVSNNDLDVSAESSEELDVEDGRLTVLSLRVARTASDDRLYPTKGTVSWIDLLYTPPMDFAADNHFASIEASVVGYRPLIAGAVLAARVKAGAVEPLQESVDVIPTYRFYSGGASSMRGFKRRRLGPRDGAGDPLGGETKFEAAAELRFRLWWLFRGALFVDTGQVWERSNDTDLSDLEVAVGPGIWLATPIGPFRFDAARRITDIDHDEPEWVYHLAIGPAF